MTRRLPPPLHHGGGGKLGQSELCPVRARARAHHPRRLRPGPALRRSSPRPACPPPSLLPPPRPSAAAAGEEEPGLLGGGWSGDVCAPVYFVIFCAPRRPGGARVGGGGQGAGAPLAAVGLRPLKGSGRRGGRGGGWMRARTWPRTQRACGLRAAARRRLTHPGSVLPGYKYLIHRRSNGVAYAALPPSRAAAPAPFCGAVGAFGPGGGR